MAFHRSTLTTLYALFLCMEFSPVSPQIRSDRGLPLVAASPVTGPDLPPLVGQAPGSSKIPIPAGALQPQPQVTNMIEALRDAGPFGAIAGLLDGLQMKSLTPMTTWLLPNDQAFSDINYPKNLTTFLDYHVIRELLPFSRLLTLETGIRLTFLGSETCLVTNSNQFNFSIDNARIVVPDLYRDSNIAVHGIDAVLDDARFNGIAVPPSSSPASTVSPIPSDIGRACGKRMKCPAPRPPRSNPPPPPPPFEFESPPFELPPPLPNFSFPNAAHGLYTTKRVYITVASALLELAATVLL